MTTRWYRTGTIAVTDGSKEVVGTNTFWVDSPIKPLAGDAMIISGVIYEIESITDNTHLKLFNPFTGNAPRNGEYKVIRNASLNLTSRVAAMVAQIVNEKQDLYDLVEGFYTSDDAVIHFDLGNGMVTDVKPIKQLEHDIRELAAGITGATANAITGFTANTLPAGQQATADWDPQTGMVTLGIPRGEDGTSNTGTGTGTGTGTVIGSGSLDLHNNKIVNVTGGSDPGDVVNVQQLNVLINKISAIEKDIASVGDRAASLVATNQDVHANLPDTVQKVLDILWSRKTAAPLSLGVWSHTDLTNDGGFAQSANNTFKVYAYNDDGVKALASLEAMFPNYDWVWTYSQNDVNFPVEMFKLTSVAYDSVAEVLTFTTDGFSNWNNGALSMYLIPVAKSSGGGGAVADGNPLGSYSLLDNFDSPPNDYKYCDGSEISRTTFSKLFNKVGVKYGKGDGAATFNLPSQDVLPPTPYGAKNSMGFDKGERTQGIAVNSKTKDIYVIGQIGSTSSYDVYKQAGGVGPWVSQGYDAGTHPIAIAVNETSGDIYVIDSFLRSEVFKKSTGGGGWVALQYRAGGGHYAFGISVNQSNGDVWVTDQNGPEVYKLASGDTLWTTQGYNAQNSGDNLVPTGVAVDHLTGDVWVIDKKRGRLSVKRGGTGLWIQEDLHKNDSAQISISINPNTKDIFIMIYTFANLYVIKNGIGKLVTIMNTDSNLMCHGVSVDYMSGDVYFTLIKKVEDTSDVYKLFGVPQWFIKAQ